MARTPREEDFSTSLRERIALRSTSVDPRRSLARVGGDASPSRGAEGWEMGSGRKRRGAEAAGDEDFILFLEAFLADDGGQWLHRRGGAGAWREGDFRGGDSAHKSGMPKSAGVGGRFLGHRKRQRPLGDVSNLLAASQPGRASDWSRWPAAAMLDDGRTPSPSVVPGRHNTTNPPTCPDAGEGERRVGGAPDARGCVRTISHRHRRGCDSDRGWEPDGWDVRRMGALPPGEAAIDALSSRMSRLMSDSGALSTSSGRFGSQASPSARPELRAGICLALSANDGAVEMECDVCNVLEAASKAGSPCGNGWSQEGKV
eukprot:evm.model.scf_1369.1 EVM.evm.TU.scf_1369.1   scf_1369:14258-15916(+)